MNPPAPVTRLVFEEREFFILRYLQYVQICIDRTETLIWIRPSLGDVKSQGKISNVTAKFLSLLWKVLFLIGKLHLEIIQDIRNNDQSGRCGSTDCKDFFAFKL